MPTSTPAITVDCYVRTSALVAPIDSTVETLREYETTGHIDELRVEAWPDELPLTGEHTDANVLKRYETFTAWADSHGVELSPAFSVRERTTLLNDTTSRMLVLPMVCLAIYVGGELASVVPHATATTSYTVSDAVTDLREVDNVPVPPAVVDLGDADDTATTDPDPREADQPRTLPLN